MAASKHFRVDKYSVPKTPQKGALLEYGVLDAKVVVALKKRIAAATGVAEAGALSKAVYAYMPTIDTKVGVGEK